MKTRAQYGDDRPFLFAESYPHAIAGQQITLVGLLRFASTQGVATAVSVPDEGAFCDWLRRDGIDPAVWSQPDSLSRYGGAIYRDGIGQKLHTLVATLRYVWRLRDELGRLRPAAVYCNDLRALLTVGLAARLRGLPVLIWDKLDKPHGRLDWLQLLIANRNPVISRAVVFKYPRWQRFLYRWKIEVLHDGIDLGQFEGLPSTKPREFPDRGPVVGIVGSVTRRKGHDRILGIWQRLLKDVPDAQLVIIGEAPSVEDRTWAAGLPSADHPSVTWMGMRHDIPHLMGALDVLVVPSRHEGMGRVCIEAMAAGTPVVAARVGGIPEVVADGETGLLFDPSNAEQFLACLRTLCVSEKERSRLGAAGRAMARREFAQEDCYARVLGILREMVPAS